jgi:hypothetical protein
MVFIGRSLMDNGGWQRRPERFINVRLIKKGGKMSLVKAVNELKRAISSSRKSNWDYKTETHIVPVKKKLVKTKRSSSNYVDEFLSLKCVGDVLNVCNPLGKNSRKEISESMALIKKIKALVIPNPNKYNILDLCAGNALTSVLAVHLLPVDYAVAIDKKPRDRNWRAAKRFTYNQGIDIFDTNWTNGGEYERDYINKNTIIVSSHPCGELSRRIISIYQKTSAKALFIMPCCIGKIKGKYPNEIRSRLGKDWLWCWDLSRDIGDVKLTKDHNCLSPRNIILSHVFEMERDK